MYGLPPQVVHEDEQDAVPVLCLYDFTKGRQGKFFANDELVKLTRSYFDKYALSTNAPHARTLKLPLFAARQPAPSEDDTCFQATAHTREEEP